MQIADRGSDYGEAFLRLFYPAYCGACRTFLEMNENGICSGCRQQVERLSYSPAEAALENRFDAIDEAWGLFPYESPVKDLIASIKFMKKRWLVRVFDSPLINIAKVLAAETHYDALVPIPLSLQNLIGREFNQAELIAARLAASVKIPVQTHLLRKRRHVSAQSQLFQKERETNPIGVFEAGEIKKITGKSFLLVDDVITTGATAEEAARTLKQHGAKRVDLFALAQTLRTL